MHSRVCQYCPEAALEPKRDFEPTASASLARRRNDVRPHLRAAVVLRRLHQVAARGRKPTMSPRQSRGALLALLIVLSAHAAGLAALLRTTVTPASTVVPPTIQGVVIPLPPADVVQAPSKQQEPPPKPKPVKRKPKPKQKKKLRPKPKPKPEPLPELAPSETAISTPPEEELPEQIPEPAPPEIPVEKEAEESGAPIVPPFVDANQVNNPAPVYPRTSRRRGEEGVVMLDVFILPDGSVGELRLRKSSGHKRLDDTAMEAVRQWQYQPAMRGDKAISFWYVQPLEFFLNR